MTPKEKLFEAFGELIYAVAKADGSVQNEEKDVLKALLKHHQFELPILWSFKYEDSNFNTVKDAYAKAIQTFKDYGPFEGYDDLFMIMEEVAKAFQGITPEEKALINNFKKDLEEAFRNREQ